VSPATVTASGTLGTIEDVQVTLTGFSHTNVGDMTFYLVGPGGASGVWLFGELNPAPADANTVDVTLVFSDAATGAIPEVPAGGLTSGTYQANTPYNSPTLPSGDPPAITMYNSFVSAFGGTSADGDWSLYAWDDSAFDTGLLESWQISITTNAPSPPGGVNTAGTPEPGTAMAALLALAGAAFLRRRRR
jgi:uncharacterized protein (TIGR03382 family)